MIFVLQPKFKVLILRHCRVPAIIFLHSAACLLLELLMPWSFSLSSVSIGLVEGLLRRASAEVSGVNTVLCYPFLSQVLPSASFAADFYSLL